jgi:hypothetical protein
MLLERCDIGINWTNILNICRSFRALETLRQPHELLKHLDTFENSSALIVYLQSYLVIVYTILNIFKMEPLPLLRSSCTISDLTQRV